MSLDQDVTDIIFWYAFNRIISYVQMCNEESKLSKISEESDYRL